LKRSSSFIDFIGSDNNDEEDDETQPAPKRCAALIDLTVSDDDREKSLWKNNKSTGHGLEDDDSLQIAAEGHFKVDDEPVRLTDAQETVVQLALDGHNIFLTGAAGSGKTATLKEILRRIRGNAQVAAPTGIAALPLNGRTLYSFAGW
jgi:Cdc6-like AAA superfamily ATPase